ncbi:MAG: PAS domain S-box protein [Ectothiorhodospiraceae bacterium]|nr:PAS domain S-box protein [Ectothiorhodospiraceae bacterium]
MQNGGVGPFIVNSRRPSSLPVVIPLCCLTYALLVPATGLGFLPGSVELVDWWDRGLSVVALSLGLLAAGLLSAQLASWAVGRPFGLLALLLFPVGLFLWSAQPAFWLASPMMLAGGMMLLRPFPRERLRQLALLPLVGWPALLLLLVTLTPSGNAPLSQTYISVPALTLFLLLGLVFYEHARPPGEEGVPSGTSWWIPATAFASLILITLLFMLFLSNADRESAQALLAGGVLIGLLVATSLHLLLLSRLSAGAARAAEERIRQAEQELELAGREQRRLVDRLADTLEGLGDAFLMLDAAGRILYRNQQGDRLFPSNGGHDEGKPFWDTDGIGGSPALRKAAERVLAGRVPETLELRDDRLATWLELRVFPTEDGLALYGRDVSGRRETLDAMRVQAQIIDQMHDAVIGVDTQGRLSIWNRGAQRLFGTPQERALGMPLRNLFPDGDDQSASLLQDLLHEDAREVETVMKAAGGESRSVWLSSSRLNGSRGEEVGVLLLIMDISQRKQGEQQVARALAKAHAYAEQLRGLASLSTELGALTSVDDVLQRVVEKGRRLVGVHQAAITVLPEGNWGNATSRVALSEKYADYRRYDRPMAGAGIYRLVIEQNRSMRMKQAELEAHPAWRGFEDQGGLHPPMRGWLAVPLVLHNGENLGVLQFSDRYRGEFSADDEAVAQQLAHMAAVAVQNHRLLQQLRATQERMQQQAGFMTAIAQSLGEGVMVLDTEGRVEMLNVAGERLLGRSADALRGTLPWPSLNVEPPDADALYRGLELTLMREQGQALVLHVVASTLRGVAFRSGTVLIMRDVTKEKESLRQLEERERFFRLSSEIMLISAPDGTVLHVNDAFQAVLGYPPEEVLGRIGAYFVVPEDREQVTLRIRELHAGANAVQIEVRHPRVDGELIWLDWRATLGPDGQVFAVGRDVTERKAAAAVLTQTLEHLEARNRELQDFAFIASHDLQEPLRKIQAFSDRLMQRHAERLDDQGQDYLQRMHGATSRMQGLLDSLLSYSRVTSHGAEFRQEDLGVLADEVLQDLEELFTRTGAHIAVEPLFFAQVDPAQFRQMLQNLIANAIKFQPPGQTAEVRIGSEEALPFRRLSARGRFEQVAARTLVVADNGIGIEPKYRDRIFAPFRRLHGRQQYEGLGMGLAIVRRIVERHGGTISVGSGAGGGSVFRIALPLRQPQHARAPE